MVIPLLLVISAAAFIGVVAFVQWWAGPGIPRD